MYIPPRATSTSRSAPTKCLPRRSRNGEHERGRQILYLCVAYEKPCVGSATRRLHDAASRCATLEVAATEAGTAEAVTTTTAHAGTLTLLRVPGLVETFCTLKHLLQLLGIETLLKLLEVGTLYLNLLLVDVEAQLYLLEHFVVGELPFLLFDVGLLQVAQIAQGILIGHEEGREPRLVGVAELHTIGHALGTLHRALESGVGIARLLGAEAETEGGKNEKEEK